MRTLTLKEKVDIIQEVESNPTKKKEQDCTRAQNSEKHFVEYPNK